MASRKSAVEDRDSAVTEQESMSSKTAQNELGHPIEDDPTVDGDLAVHKQKWFVRLTERWAKHHSVSLQLRFDTGSAINAKIGTPEKRQPRGYGVTETLAGAIGMDPGEISRMRWFAFRVQHFKAFCRERPDIQTWDSVKTWLADEARKERGEDALEEAKSPVDRVVRSIQAAAKSLPKPQKIEEDDMDDLLHELKKFGRELKKLGVALTITELTEMANTELQTVDSAAG